MGVASKVSYILYGVLMAVAASGIAASGDEHESRHEDAERATHGAETGELMPLAKIIAAVRERYTGDIVDTEFEFEHGRPYYEFYILQSDGRLIEIKVDARSGRYLASGSDD